jgi:hypothetical protein
MLNVQIARADWKAEKTELRGKSESWSETSKDSSLFVSSCPAGTPITIRGTRMLPEGRKPRQFAPPELSSCRLFIEREARAFGGKG